MPDQPLMLFDATRRFRRMWIEYWKFLTGDRTGYGPGSFFHHVTRLTFGPFARPLDYGRVQWLFLRSLALIYLVAFGSLGLQIAGLIGEHGIQPVGRYLDAIRHAVGIGGLWMSPGIFWLAHSDGVLRAVCIAGMIFSVVLLFGFFERVSLVTLYVLYLSLCSAGQDFLSFQWDMLLLETGFLAIFLGSSPAIIFLFRWLLFRLMFLSGAVKLLSRDRTWRDLSALDFHFWTQPLPTPISWYANQLPPRLLHFFTGSTLFVELVIPFLIFAPRRLRHFAALCLLSLQAVIFLTGNYTFFNLLTMALCIFLFDDASLGWLHVRIRMTRVNPALAFGVAILIGGLSLMELWGVFTGRESSAPVRVAAPFGIVNTYGLFAVMTTTRPEIVVQGSNDGQTWLDYEFKFKTGDLRKAPRWAAPYQPRLDWQMWFAALEGRSPAWFDNFMVRLLQGSPDVLVLLAGNPFPSAPPKYVRALLYEYSFTDFQTRRATGNWWKRMPAGRYFPEIELSDVRSSNP